MSKKTINTHYEIRIIRQRRASLMMRAHTGHIKVYIPLWLRPNSPEVQKFIREGLVRIQDRLLPARDMLHTPEDIRHLVKHWAQRMGVKPARLTLREMHNKWGSCSSRGHVLLNTLLQTVPFDLLEYVVVHELAHLKEFNHSPQFWALVETHLPDYQRRRDEIDRILI